MNPVSGSGRFRAILLKSVCILLLSCGTGASLHSQDFSLILENPELEAYHGWIHYLSLETKMAVERHGAGSEEALRQSDRLVEWTIRILNQPNIIHNLRGVQEWAYLSPVDGSGQPFKIMIPTDYDPKSPAAINLYMHGYAGNHLEHSTGITDAPGQFEIAVLGRARGGWYQGLSEADVLHVLEYVQKTWVTDPARVHICGGSMGGGATFRLASRYPHLFASGRPTCGFAEDKPLANLIDFPLYATHSKDDPVVPALHSIGPMNWIINHGGRAILDLTDGLGHAAWDYAEGNTRGTEWALRQTRPDSREVRRIDYTATDGNATSAWWASIAEWGDSQGAARFVLNAGSDGTLHARLSNIRSLRINLTQSPYHQKKLSRFSVNGGLPVSVPSNLAGDIIYLTLKDDGNWVAENQAPAPELARTRAPGSAWLLYNGEPLMIVRGTSDKPPMVDAMRQAAEAAARSPHPTWRWNFDPSDAGAEGVPHTHLLYGNLPVKADTEITDEDISSHHLVLIGNAAQNTLVARLALDLPVKIVEGSIRCSDGWQTPAKGRAFAVTFPNPRAPQFLIHWYAAEDMVAYAPDPIAHKMIAGTFFGADFAVADTAQPALVATRNMNARWQWIASDNRDDPAVPKRLRTHGDIRQLIAQAMILETNSDYAIISSDIQPDLQALISGDATRNTITAPLVNQHFAVMELHASDLVQVADRLAASSGPRASAFVYPRVLEATIDKNRVFRVAISTEAVWPFNSVGQAIPLTYRQCEGVLPDAIVKHWHHLTR